MLRLASPPLVGRPLARSLAAAVALSLLAAPRELLADDRSDAGEATGAAPRQPGAGQETDPALPAPPADDSAARPDATSLRIGGRIVAGWGSYASEEWRQSIGISTARLGVAGRSGFADGEVEVDLADRRVLKDAWVRAGGDALAARIGLFKSPFGRLALFSSWDLPLPDRGAVHEHVVDGYGFGGRNVGAEVRLSRAAWWDATLRAGVFAHRDLDADRPRSLDMGPLGGFEQDAALRFEIEPIADLELGAGTYLRGAEDGHYSARGIDVRYRPKQWTWAAELLSGDDPTRPAPAVFTAQSLLASRRFPLGEVRIAPALLLERIVDTAGVARSATGGLLLSNRHDHLHVGAWYGRRGAPAPAVSPGRGGPLGADERISLAAGMRF